MSTGVSELGGWAGVLDAAVAVRAYRGEIESGDAGVIAAVGGATVLALIDGLGHGREAARAARAAALVIERAQSDDPEHILQACHAALQGTRGAAVTVAIVDAGCATVRMAGVGNVSCRLRRAADTGELATPLRGGIVGASLPRLVPSTRQLASGDLILLHTDGVRDDVDWSVLRTHGAALAAARLLDQGATGTDDAGVVAARVLPGESA